MKQKSLLKSILALSVFLMGIAYASHASPPTTRHVQKESVSTVTTTLYTVQTVAFYHTGPWIEYEATVTSTHGESYQILPLAVMPAEIIMPKWRQGYVVPRSIGKIRQAFSGTPGLVYFPKLC